MSYIQEEARRQAARLMALHGLSTLTPQQVVDIKETAAAAAVEDPGAEESFDLVETLVRTAMDRKFPADEVDAKMESYRETHLYDHMQELAEAEALEQINTRFEGEQRFVVDLHDTTATVVNVFDPRAEWKTWTTSS